MAKKGPTLQSADDLIVRVEAEKLGTPIPESKEKPLSVEKTTEQKSEITDDNIPENKDEQDPGDQEASQEESGEELQSEEKEETSEDASDDSPAEDHDVDDYGNKVPKAKLYTEKEVQEMIRDRLKRGQHAESQQQVAAEAAKNFTADPESTESWETQLEGFIESTLTKLATKKQQQEWKQKEESTQAEFEIKFTRGMEKYPDFADVVANKPISNSMMMATRSMQDPAAFIYAACKQHPGEIERIAKMDDTVSQIAEIGRLEERMKKAKNISRAPKPSTRVSGDASSEMPKHSVDDLITAHAKLKIMNRR